MLSIAARVLVLLASVSTVLCSRWRVYERAMIVDNTSTLNESYDYVIIGGGTSGLTVADRLTENPKSMLVLCADSTYETAD